MPFKDKEAERIWRREYYLRNKEKMNQQSKEWVAAHPERRKEIGRESARRKTKTRDAATKQKRSMEMLKWQKANPERVNERNKRWRENNPEKVKQVAKNWRLMHRDKSHEWKQIRRARELGAFVEKVNRVTVYDRANGICGICHKPVDKLNFHVDRIIPLSKGGTHCYANVQPAHPACNIRKSNKVS